MRKHPNFVHFIYFRRCQLGKFFSHFEFPLMECPGKRLIFMGKKKQTKTKPRHSVELSKIEKYYHWRAKRVYDRRRCNSNSWNAIEKVKDVLLFVGRDWDAFMHEKYNKVRRCRWQQIEMVFNVYCLAMILLAAFYTFILVQTGAGMIQTEIYQFFTIESDRMRTRHFHKARIWIGLSHKRCHNNYRFIGIWLVLIECEAIIPPNGRIPNTEYYIERTNLVIGWREKVQSWFDWAIETF